jgi:hypothetical protein
MIINSKSFAQVQNITITSKVNPDKSVDLYYEKKLPGSYFISLEFLNISNCDTDQYKTVVTNYSGSLLKLLPINKNQGIGYSLRYYSIIGNPNPKVDSDFQYVLPFKNGKKIKINEASYIGEKYFGSEKPKNWTDYIVNSESPDTLYCMRKGIVVKIENEYDADTSIEVNYTSKRNSITIEHGDGTFARYVGFQKNSIRVRLGQTVYPQTQLGILEVFNKNKYRGSFSVYFLSDKDIKSHQNETIKNYVSNYEYITPNFATQEGTIKVESGKEYTSLYNETLLLQELTHSEKKKYLKNTLF